MIEIVPTILRIPYSDFKKRAAVVAGLVSHIQVDVVDGIYAPDPTWPYIDDTEAFERLKNGEEVLPESERLIYEADLLIARPEISLDSWIAAGFKQFVIHLESTTDLERIIGRLRTAVCGVGLAFKPRTPDEVVLPWVPQVDFVQCMGNDVVGQAGVSLDPSVLGRIRDLRASFPELPIGVDIGVNVETAPMLVAAGATRLAAGSAIFKSDDPAEAIRKLQGETV